jgi:hypothetical protein
MNIYHLCMENSQSNFIIYVLLLNILVKYLINCILSEEWNSYYPERNLIAYAIQPNIIDPTHYYGESGYVSDTEKTTVLNTKLFELNSFHKGASHDLNKVHLEL